MTTERLVKAREELTRAILHWNAAGIPSMPEARKVDEAVAELETAAIHDYLVNDMIQEKDRG